MARAPRSGHRVRNPDQPSQDIRLVRRGPGSKARPVAQLRGPGRCLPQQVRQARVQAARVAGHRAPHQQRWARFPPRLAQCSIWPPWLPRPEVILPTAFPLRRRRATPRRHRVLPAALPTKVRRTKERAKLLRPMRRLRKNRRQARRPAPVRPLRPVGRINPAPLRPAVVRAPRRLKAKATMRRLLRRQVASPRTGHLRRRTRHPLPPTHLRHLHRRKTQPHGNRHQHSRTLLPPIHPPGPIVPARQHPAIRPRHRSQRFQHNQPQQRLRLICKRHLHPKRRPPHPRRRQVQRNNNFQSAMRWLRSANWTWTRRLIK